MIVEDISDTKIETNKKILVPSLKWYQSKEYIYMTVDVSLAKDNGIKLFNKNIIFNVISGDIQYYLEFEFYKGYNLVDSKYFFTEKNVKIILKKNDNENWDRLTLNKNCYKNNIKIDWDLWVNEQSDDEDNKNANNYQQQIDFQRMMEGMGGIQNMQDMMGNMNLNDFENLPEQDEDNNENDDSNIENEEDERDEEDYCQECSN
jgi:hypothetical protein